MPPCRKSSRSNIRATGGCAAAHPAPLTHLSSIRPTTPTRPGRPLFVRGPADPQTPAAPDYLPSARQSGTIRGPGSAGSPPACSSTGSAALAETPLHGRGRAGLEALRPSGCARAYRASPATASTRHAPAVRPRIPRRPQASRQTLRLPVGPSFPRVRSRPRNAGSRRHSA